MYSAQIILQHILMLLYGYIVLHNIPRGVIEGMEGLDSLLARVDEVEKKTSKIDGMEKELAIMTDTVNQHTGEITQVATTALEAKGATAAAPTEYDNVLPG
jgi:hypothetical protein